jgi:hypothetical protein
MASDILMLKPPPSSLSSSTRYLLSEDVRRSLEAYKSEAYSDINDTLRLRKEPTDEIKRHIENIDSVMRKGDRIIKVYRGIPDIKRFFSEEASPIIVDLAFTSSSTDINVARRFTSNRCCLVEFNLPTDMGRYEYGDNDEKEILIQRSTQLIIDDSPFEKNGYTTYKAIIKPYIPPVITKDDIEDLKEDDMIEIENFSKDWFEELKTENEEFGNETNEDLEVVK